jgi:hypothetical protein
MQKLLNKVDALAAQISNADVLNNTVSQGNIGWHIEHSCLVIIKITETIQASNPIAYHEKFNFKKWIVFLTGKFPRGRAKAPESVLPIQNISIAHLQESIIKAKAAIDILNTCEKNKYFKHPIFDNLNVPKTIHFLGIHTNHHLTIIQDILKK